ncbi:MAG: class I SAM-dependent DNA methyltransferase [Candidatus Brocadiia bacterium]
MAGRPEPTPRLAQYFTPRPVVAFAFDVLEKLGLGGGPLRVVDPACGDGAFLLEARRRLPQAELWGCDLDARLAERWKEAGLAGPGCHLLACDGLADAPLFGLGAGTFDLAVGNPPYGFGVPRPRAAEPVEALFVRRFADLLRPGGWLAVVVPEGILANARCQRLRDGLLARLSLAAVVALPETTFAACGTRARTALLFARRGQGPRGPVLTASPEGRGELEDYLADVLRAVETRGE